MISPYQKILNAAWRSHKKKRADAPTVISTFAGCGGSSLGYSMAGFKELLAVEWDKGAAENFKLNFPNVPLLVEDITKLTAKRCLEITELKKGELDLLDGSPPCQGFSTANRNWKKDDTRNFLFYAFAKLIQGLQPKIFVMENVAGVIKGKNRLIFREIMRSLRRCGYRVSCRLIETQWFQVPQIRKRLIWIGVRENLKISIDAEFLISNPITVRQALEGVPDGLHYHPISGESGEIVKKMRAGKSGSEVAGKNRYFNWLRASWDSPCPTIIKCVRMIIHPSRDDRFTIPELKRLSSFPD